MKKLIRKITAKIVMLLALLLPLACNKINPTEPPEVVTLEPITVIDTMPNPQRITYVNQNGTYTRVILIHPFYSACIYSSGKDEPNYPSLKVDSILNIKYRTNPGSSDPPDIIINVIKDGHTDQMIFYTYWTVRTIHWIKP